MQYVCVCTQVHCFHHRSGLFEMKPYSGIVIHFIQPVEIQNDVN